MRQGPCSHAGAQTPSILWLCPLLNPQNLLQSTGEQRRERIISGNCFWTYHFHSHFIGLNSLTWHPTFTPPNPLTYLIAMEARKWRGKKREHRFGWAFDSVWDLPEANIMGREFIHCAFFPQRLANIFVSLRSFFADIKSASFLRAWHALGTDRHVPSSTGMSSNPW